MLTPAMRAVFGAFALLALTAGLLLVVGADNTDETFSWTIQPPLTAATLGAIYWSALVLMGPLVRGGPWRLARPAVYPVASIAVLLLAATLVELDTLDLDSLFGWFWLVVYCVVPFLLAAAIWDQLRQPGSDEAEERRPLSTGLSLALGIEGVILVAAGLVLFAAPESAADIWPWPLGALSSRVIGAFVLGIGLSALLALREKDLVAFRGSAWASAALSALALGALALHTADLGPDDTATALYVAFLVAMLATSLWGALAAGRAGAQPASSAASASARS